MSGRDTAFLSEALSSQVDGAICACARFPLGQCAQQPYVLRAHSHVLSPTRPRRWRAIRCHAISHARIRNPLLRLGPHPPFPRLSRHHSARADVVESYLGPRDANMAPLPYPPIHVHHIHLLPKMEALRFHGEGFISDSYKQQLALERHGEWTRLGLGAIDDKMANGMATELEPAGYGRRISFEMDMDAELNDARVANSASIQWYIEFAIRWMPGNGPTKPVTLTNCINIQAPAWGYRCPSPTPLPIEHKP